MAILNLILMSLSLMILIGFLIQTRKKDTCEWWAMRSLLIYSIIVNVYMLFDAWELKNRLPISLIMIQLGFFTLTLALLLGWHLMRKRTKLYKKQRFNQRIQAIFKENI